MKATVTFPDFEKLDLRIGKVVSCEAPEWSEKLLVYKVDFGSEIGERTICSGIRAWYSPEDLVGGKFPFIVNLAERKMGEAVSQGMMFMIDGPDERPLLMPVDDSAVVGSVVR